MPFDLPPEFEAAMTTCDEAAREDRARIGCELLDAIGADERPIVLAAMLRIEATTAIHDFQTRESARLIAQHAHNEGRALEEQTTTALLLTTEPQITH